MVVAETLLAAVMSGLYHFTDGQEIEENLIISKRRAISEHDHRTDSAYGGILSITQLALVFYFSKNNFVEYDKNLIRIPSRNA